MVKEADPTIKAIGGIIRTVFESGIPQQLVQGGINMGTSLVQAGAQNPLYAAIAATVAVEAGNKVGLIPTVQRNALLLAADGYIAIDLAGKVGGAASKSVSNAVTFDIPDVPVPKLPPRPPGAAGLFQIPKVPRQVAAPEPVPAPVDEPLPTVPAVPIEVPVELPSGRVVTIPVFVPTIDPFVGPIFQPGAESPRPFVGPTQTPAGTRAPEPVPVGAPLPVGAISDDPTLTLEDEAFEAGLVAGAAVAAGAAGAAAASRGGVAAGGLSRLRVSGRGIAPPI